MVHIEHDESGHALIIDSALVMDYEQVEDINAFMEAHGIQRGILRDVISQDKEPREEAIAVFDHAVWECFFLDAVMLIPRFLPLLQDRFSYSRFMFWLVASGVPFRAFDLPELKQDSLVQELRARNFFFSDGETLEFAVKNAKRFGKARHIRASLQAAKRGGKKLGNPRILDARAKAQEIALTNRPSDETLKLIAAWRQEGKSLREIARLLNEREIKPPRGKQWYASSVRNQLS